MSDMTLPAQHFPQTNSQGALHIAMPIIQPQSPIWTDSLTRTYYVTSPTTVIQSQPQQPTPTPTPTLTPTPTPAPAPTPRPRKPYTTTKVREMWTAQEHERMIRGLKLYKRDWAKVTSYVGTRSTAQVRSHAQKYFDRVARDNTDEFVPRARPKRKSSTPYPRKARQQPSNTNIHAHHPSASPIFPLPAVHPSATSFEVQPVSFASSQLHHPVRIAPGQSPILSQVPTSPYIAQSHQHVLNPQIALPHRIYTPFMDTSSTPVSNPRSDVHPSPEIQASPLSYVTSHMNVPQSPLSQQTIAIPATHMYGMLSPFTPAALSFNSANAASVTRTPVTVCAQPSTAGSNSPHPTLRHSHPEGPIDGCAKCAALRRYGEVLQEIGELNYVRGEPDQQVQHGNGHYASSPRLNDADTATDPTVATSKRIHDRKKHVVDGRGGSQALSKSGSGPLSLRNKTQYTLSPACFDDAVERCTHTTSADNRAHRAKIIRARKTKQRNTTKERPRNPSGTYEGQLGSGNSTLAIQRPLGEDSTLPPQNPSSSTTGTVTRKRKVSSERENETRKTKVRKEPRRSIRSEGREEHSGHRDNMFDGKSKLADRQNRLSRQERCSSHDSCTYNECTQSPKSDESETGAHSPPVETYSPKERMELFDAVHSLQILAKTSSSGSPSLGSKDDPKKKEE